MSRVAAGDSLIGKCQVFLMMINCHWYHCCLWSFLEISSSSFGCSRTFRSFSQVCTLLLEFTCSLDQWRVSNGFVNIYLRRELTKKSMTYICFVLASFYSSLSWLIYSRNVKLLSVPEQALSLLRNVRKGLLYPKWMWFLSETSPFILVYLFI